MEFRRVDPDDLDAMTSFIRVAAEAETFENPYATPWTLEEKREALRNRVPSEVVEAYVGVVAGAAVAVGLLELPLLDNTDKAWLETAVAPGDRRRGYGTAMAQYVEQLAQQHGRTTLMAEVTYPFDGDENHPDRKFMTRRGYRFSQANVHRVLDLPADPEMLAQLQQEAAERHADYTLGDFVGLVPEEFVEEYCVLLNTIILDAPSGELTYEEGRTTPSSLAQEIDVLHSQARTLHTTVAFDSTGSPVAHNQLVVPMHDAGKVYNWDTMVRREHRGHRLGQATKVRNLAVVQGLHPDRTSMHTWNAETNTHMIAVNEAMGFRAVRYNGEYYRTL